MALPGGRRFTQVYDLNDPSVTSTRHRNTARDHRDHDLAFDDVFSSPYLDLDINGRQRKERQWKTWTTDVIPSLLRPYLRLLRETNNLRNMPTNRTDDCVCGSLGHPLSVLNVYFDRELSSLILCA